MLRPTSVARKPCPSLIPVSALAVRVIDPVAAEGVSVVVVGFIAKYGPSRNVICVNAQSSASAELWVMAPMVADHDETAYFVGLAKELGIRVAGVMAEVPSIALVADQVFEVADFVSIGTNDLTQYTLAADRLQGSLAAYQDPWHPAVLRLIKMLGDAGATAGKPVSVCGEAAADPDLAIVLVGLGATSLSMTPPALADVRAALLTVTLDEARARATRALTATSAAEARTLGSR